jgi:Fe-S cluster assembly protein SufD
VRERVFAIAGRVTCSWFIIALFESVSLCVDSDGHGQHHQLQASLGFGQRWFAHTVAAAAPHSQVNKLAQKTDAGQLSRNLLLVPKATVNVKPNLQIIADDVKCTHGCAVSDLSEEELFYFRARGVSYDQARQALVYSFGAEVVQELKYEKLVGRIQQDVRECLNRAVADM